jgi:hypothetical protein
LEVWCVGGLGIVVTTVIPRIQIGRWRSPESISSTESQAGPGRLPAAIHSQSAVVRGRWRKKGTLGKSLSMPSRPDILPTLQQHLRIRTGKKCDPAKVYVFAVKRASQDRDDVLAGDWSLKSASNSPSFSFPLVFHSSCHYTPIALQAI